MVVNVPVRVMATGEDLHQQGSISRIDIVTQPNQSVLARVVLDNPNGKWVPGMFVTGEIPQERHLHRHCK